MSNQFVHTAETEDEVPLTEVAVSMVLRLRLEQPIEDWLPIAIDENLDFVMGERLLDYEVKEL